MAIFFPSLLYTGLIGYSDTKSKQLLVKTVILNAVTVNNQACMFTSRALLLVVVHDVDGGHSDHGDGHDPDERDDQDLHPALLEEAARGGRPPRPRP